MDRIIYRQLERIESGEVKIVAMILRSNFDFAKTRKRMFVNNEYYVGQIKMLFRVWWSDERSCEPIHNYVWHIWSEGQKYKQPSPPSVFYYDAPYDERYTKGYSDAVRK